MIDSPKLPAKTTVGDVLRTDGSHNLAARGLQDLRNHGQHLLPLPSEETLRNSFRDACERGDYEGALQIILSLPDQTSAFVKELFKELRWFAEPSDVFFLKDGNFETAEAIDLRECLKVIAVLRSAAAKGHAVAQDLLRRMLADPHGVLGYDIGWSERRQVIAVLGEGVIPRPIATAAREAAARAKSLDELRAVLEAFLGEGVIPPQIATAARGEAVEAKNLDELRVVLEAFQGCALRDSATRLVFGDGNPQAHLMFIGECPGYQDGIAGRPFVGRSGKLLDRMMEAIGLNRRCAYIANVVPWRPPGNRTPTPQETAICLPFIRRQIELADPDILVCLGQPATQTLLGTKEGITQTRGRWFKYDTGRREIRAVATLRPAYLLRQPLQKRLAWRDFLAIKHALMTVP
jgi:uracil-DNA glycosylase